MALGIRDILDSIGWEWVEDFKLTEVFPQVDRSEVRSALATGLRSKSIVSRKDSDGTRWVRRNRFDATEVDSLIAQRSNFSHPMIGCGVTDSVVTLTIGYPPKVVTVQLSIVEAETLADKLNATTVGWWGSTL